MLAGCSKNIQTNDAVKQGVVNHLAQSKSIQLAAMDLEVTAVTFKDNLAEATVSIKPKGGAAAAGMQMQYTLEKKGDAWVVQKKADGGAGHGAVVPGGMGGMAPSTEMPAMPAGEMPPGHPPAGAPKK